MVNFPFLSSNIPSGPSYGVYISQLVRYARCCTYYAEFRYRHKLLVDRLFFQGSKVNQLRNYYLMRAAPRQVKRYKAWATVGGWVIGASSNVVKQETISTRGFLFRLRGLLVKVKSTGKQPIVY